MNLRLSLAGALAGIIFVALPCLGQVLFDEQFMYPAGALLTSEGYAAHSGAGSTPVAVSAGSLIYPSYAPSERGNSVTLTGGSGTREDVNHTFAAVSFGSVYVSFLVSVTSMSTAGDYFFHLGPTNLTTVFRAKILAKTTSAGALAFGISKSASADSAISWTPFEYSPGTTYLLVLKYAFSAGTASDDRVDLWVNPSTSGPEPASTIHQTDTGSDAAEIGSFALRQGSVSSAIRIDALTIRLSWFDNPLPIQLVRFAGAVGAGGVTLNWTTASELNCYGFEVQKSASRNGGFSSISGLIPGHGTTTSPEDYSYVDSAGASGGYYRLRQIDLDQTEHFSDILQVGVSFVAVSGVPAFSRLLDCYPNPFNPGTTIPILLSTPSTVRLAVFDLLGREIALLVDGRLSAGRHAFSWNASAAAAGVYVVVAEIDRRREAKKVVLVR